MMQRDLFSQSKCRMRALLQDLRANRRVPLHHRKLSIRELAWLHQEAIRNAQFTDVVQTRGELNIFRELVTVAERIREQAGELPDTVGVTTQ